MPAAITAPDSLDEQITRLFHSEPAAMADPDAVWRRLRDEAPVYRYRSAKVFSRYADVKAIHRDAKRVGNRGYGDSTEAAARRERFPAHLRGVLDEVNEFELMMVSRTDGEEHDRLRRIAHRAFAPRAIAALRSSIQAYTDELLEPLVAGGGGDFMAFAYQLPLMVVADLLGVPRQEREPIHGWSNKIGANLHSSDAATLLAARQAIQEFREYVLEVVRRHRLAPEDSPQLVARLLSAEDGDQLSSEELTVMFVQLLFAGHETTTNLIAIGLIELMEHRDQWERLCADPRLAGRGTDELLRFVSPAQYQMKRVVIEELEVAGTPLQLGETVVTVYAAANRDPSVFAAPERLDLTRANARDHLALGFGPHYCLGASMARLEGEVAFATLATRFPELRLHIDRDAIRWKGNSSLRTLESLPVRLGPERIAA
jgi:cytochrome P450